MKRERRYTVCPGCAKPGILVRESGKVSRHHPGLLYALRAGVNGNPRPTCEGSGVLVMEDIRPAPGMVG